MSCSHNLDCCICADNWSLKFIVIDIISWTSYLLEWLSWNVLLFLELTAIARFLHDWEIPTQLNYYTYYYNCRMQTFQLCFFQTLYDAHRIIFTKCIILRVSTMHKKTRLYIAYRRNKAKNVKKKIAILWLRINSQNLQYHQL